MSRFVCTSRVSLAIRSRGGRIARRVMADAVVSEIMPEGHVRFIIQPVELRDRLFPSASAWRLIDEVSGTAYLVTSEPSVLPDGTVVLEAKAVNLFKAEQALVRKPIGIAAFA